MATPHFTPFDDDEICSLREENFQRRSTHNFPDAASSPLRGDIVSYQCRDIVGCVPPDGPPQLFIIIGLPASGKSSMANAISARMDVKVVDSDEIKGFLPEFSKGHHAGVVHEESSELNLDVLEAALAARANVILPLVGRDPDKILRYANRFNGYGYDVHLICKHSEPEVAAERAVKRFRNGEVDRKTGETIHRFVDPFYVMDVVGILPLTSYFDLIDKVVFKSRELVFDKS